MYTDFQQFMRLKFGKFKNFSHLCTQKINQKPSSRMTIQKHLNNPLNLDAFSICFLADENTGAEQTEMVLGLGRFHTFTYGLYHYVVSHRNLTAKGNENLPEELIHQLKTNNIVARLIDDTKGKTTYLFDKIEIREDKKNFYLDIAAFVARVAHADLNFVESSIKLLKRLNKRENRARIMELNTLKMVLDGGIKYVTAKSSWQEINLLTLDPIMQSRSSREKFFYVTDMLGENGIPSLKAVPLAKHLIEFLSAPVSTPSIEIQAGESNATEATNISIRIEKVAAKWGNKSVSKYGIVVVIGKHEVPICFNCIDQTMLYITALIRHQMGEPLYVHELYNNSKGLNSLHKRERSYPWLNAIFNTLFKREKGSFKSWILKIQSKYSKGRALYQAKSQSKRIIGERLKIWPEVARQCEITLGHDSQGDSYYTFGCEPSSISICSELQEILNQTHL